MPHPELQQLIDSTVASMNDKASDDTLQALRILLPENLIIAAFDLIDRGRVFKYETFWGRAFFEVFGSKGRYSVSVDLPTPVSTYCACPAFVYTVLLSDNQALCKHVLAVQIARRLGKYVVRTVTPDELVALVCQEVEPEADKADPAQSELRTCLSRISLELSFQQQKHALIITQTDLNNRVASRYPI